MNQINGHPPDPITKAGCGPAFEKCTQQTNSSVSAQKTEKIANSPAQVVIATETASPIDVSCNLIQSAGDLCKTITTADGGKSATVQGAVQPYHGTVSTVRVGSMRELAD